MDKHRSARKFGAEAELTWVRILEAAQVMLETTASPEALSMRAIAEKAAVALSTVQYYFPSKDELLESLLDDYYRRLNDVLVLVAADDEPDPQAFIATTVDRFFTFALSEQRALRLRSLLNAQKGRLAKEREFAVLLPALMLAPAVLLQRFPTCGSELRLIVHSMSLLITRYALMTAEERTAITGAPTLAAAEQQLRAHLQTTARSLLNAGPAAGH